MNKIYVSDLSNIEGRMLSWLAGETWKIEAFRKYDLGEGPDCYNLTANSIIGIDPWNVPKPIRNSFGKVPDLAFGFGGGANAARTFAANYGVHFADHWDNIKKLTDEDGIAYAKAAYVERGDHQIAADEWVATEIVKQAWRKRHPMTVKLWGAALNAAVYATLDPGVWYEAGEHLRYKGVAHKSGYWLVCQLPSGNYLTYFQPEVKDGTLSYMGTVVRNGQKIWKRIPTYGGKLIENPVQSTSRDVLYYALPKMEKAGYRVLFSVHDEGVTTAREEAGIAKLNEILAEGYDWCAGLPLSASGFSDNAYGKED